MVNLYSEYDNSHTSFGGTGGILTRIGMDPAPCSEAEDLGRLSKYLVHENVSGLICLSRYYWASRQSWSSRPARYRTLIRVESDRILSLSHQSR